MSTQIDPVYDGFQQGWENSLTRGPSAYTTEDAARIGSEVYDSYEVDNPYQNQEQFVTEFVVGWQEAQAYLRDHL